MKCKTGICPHRNLNGHCGFSKEALETGWEGCEKPKIPGYPHIKGKFIEKWIGDILSYSLPINGVRGKM